MKFSFNNVRFRLTLWYSGALTFTLLLYAVLSVILVFLNLRNNLDSQLEQDYEVTENIIETGSENSIHIDEEEHAILNERWIEIWSVDGKLLFNNRPFSGQDLPTFPRKQMEVSPMEFQSVSLVNKTHLRVLTGKTNIDGRWLFFRLIRPEGPMLEEIGDFISLLLIALPFALIIAALGGYLLAGKLLSPIGKMTEKAEKIGSTNLEERLPVKNADDELGHMAITFNALLDRIQQSFERLRQFTYDAAHELRTPLTAIRSIGEVALQESHNEDSYREIIGSILEENNRLTHLVNSLLFLSRVDSNTFEINPELTDLSALIQHTAELIQPLAEEKGQTIQIEDHITISTRIDPTLLRQALLNLLDNAIKYSPADSMISVKVSKIENQVIQIMVSDHGAPIPQEHRAKIFKRFYRLDQGRSKEIGGSGLGLSIAKWAIDIQGGEVLLLPSTETGNSFMISIPYVSPIKQQL